MDKDEIVVPDWGTEEKFKNNENAETVLKNIKKWCKNKDVQSTDPVHSVSD